MPFKGSKVPFLRYMEVLKSLPNGKLNGAVYNNEMQASMRIKGIKDNNYSRLDFKLDFRLDSNEGKERIGT